MWGRGGMMNDIRNLMGHLHTQMEYKEFDASARPPAGEWPILQRVGRLAPAAAPATPSEPDVEPEPSAARSPLVRGLRRPKRSLLDRYAPSDAAARPADDD